MLYAIERKRPIRTLRGWAISTLQDAGAIRQCEYHGWLVDCADPDAREMARQIARQAYLLTSFPDVPSLNCWTYWTG